MVTTLEEFVEYLIKKDPKTISEALLDKVPGCNKIVWGSAGTHTPHRSVPVPAAAAAAAAAAASAAAQSDAVKTGSI